MFRKFLGASAVDTDTKWMFGMMAVGAGLGIVASLVLSIEALTLAKNPDAALSCSVNIVLNCATVAKDASSEVLGFPNSFIGMLTLPVMMTIAVAGFTGVKFPKWFMRAAFIGASLGLVFAGWMFYMSYVVIQALCPWCLLTDLSMLLIFFAMLRHNIKAGYTCLPKKAAKEAEKLVQQNYDRFALAVLIAVTLLLILVKYGEGLFV